MSTKKFTKKQFDEIFSRLAQLTNSKYEYQIGEKLDITRTNLSQRKKRNSVPVDNIAILCSKNGWNFNWVMTGEGEMNQSANGNGIIQGRHIDADEIHIEIHEPNVVVREDHGGYNDPTHNLFLKDWLKLSDVGKMRVWTLLKEEIEREQEKSK